MTVLGSTAFCCGESYCKTDEVWRFGKARLPAHFVPQHILWLRPLVVGCVAVQSVVPLASRRWEVLLAGWPVGRWSESGPASVSLLTPAALGVLKARRAGLLS